ncbi:FG-GAP-like repeat-containing protein [Catenulispora subtropica]|uniref:FG-GAP-like repeat-containing protein n=1 Tax=Catenulispora subtropica TaxID=450798 RepID=A0ABN2QSL0_9ACTN
MPRRLGSILTVLGLTVPSALALAAAPASATATTPPPVVRVMPLGDSITYGVGSTSGPGGAGGAGYRVTFLNEAAAQSRYRVDLVGSMESGAWEVADPDNEGHSGALIADISAGADTWIRNARPDVILLHIGINDLDRSDDPLGAPARLHNLVDQIFADKPNVTIILQGLIPITQGLKASPTDYNNAARSMAAAEQAAGHKIQYVDPDPTFNSADMFDRLHPNDSGHSKLARVYFSAFDQAYTAGWVTPATSRGAADEVGGSGRVRWADFDGDGHADYLTVNADGSVDVWLNKGGDGHGGWNPLGQVAVGLTTDASHVRIADFDGDGRADYILINPNGSVSVWLNRGGDGHGGWTALGQVATGLTTDASKVRFADFDGDGRTDYLLFSDSGAISVWLNRGGDTAGGWWSIGQIATGLTSDPTKVRIADIDGDGYADYTQINADGSLNTWQNQGGDGHGGWKSLGRIATGTTTNADAVQLTDFNGDTHADYLRTNTNGSIEAWLWNGGDGSGGWTYDGQIATGA